jgi:hypothetical protein
MEVTVAITNNGGYTRFRSFMERYLIERASSFTKGNELEDAWNAMLDAQTLYKKMAGMSDPDDPMSHNPTATEIQAAQQAPASREAYEQLKQWYQTQQKKRLIP